MSSVTVLGDLVLPTRVNQHWTFSGLDHIDFCLDKNHFQSYPHDIDYVYNSRGFRDSEWPKSTQDLKDAVWCIGDSFTLGIGSPIAHTWPNRLSAITGRRTINISMDGASNEWIARTTEKIVNAVGPKDIVIMWSYTHRRELTDTSLCDEQRRLHTESKQTVCLADDDWNNFLHCKKRVDTIANSVQFAVPEFHPSILNIYRCWNAIKGPDWPRAPDTLKEFDQLPNYIKQEIKNLHNMLDKIVETLKLGVLYIDRLDTARDGHHFDIVTADWVAEMAAARL